MNQPYPTPPTSVGQGGGNVPTKMADRTPVEVLENAASTRQPHHQK
jgi:hypothetical protein